MSWIGKPGHKVKDCPTTKTACISAATSAGNGHSGSRRTKRGKKKIECYNCHEKDTTCHIALMMPCSVGRTTLTRRLE